MREIELTQGKVAIVDDDDFEWLNQWKWRFDIYAVRELRGKPLYMHRIILQTPIGMQTDHINGDKLDNRRENLRICSASQNKQNEGIRSNNTSGYKGAHYVSTNNRIKKWCATIWINNKSIFLGFFLTAEEAARAYDKKAIELFGDFANLNFKKE